jgi:hypothetical protein
MILSVIVKYFFCVYFGFFYFFLIVLLLLLRVLIKIKINKKNPFFFFLFLSFFLTFFFDTVTCTTLFTTNWINVTSKWEWRHITSKKSSGRNQLSILQFVVKTMFFLAFLLYKYILQMTVFLSAHVLQYDHRPHVLSRLFTFVKVRMERTTPRCITDLALPCRLGLDP